MNRYLAAITLVLGLLVAGSASASIINEVGTVSTWAANPDQMVDDKVFSYIGNSINWTDFNNLDRVTLTALPSLKTAHLVLTGLNGAVGPGSYWLNYSVEIDAWNGFTFGGARLDSTVSLPSTVVTKAIYGSLTDLQNHQSPLLTLTSLNGVPDPVFPPSYLGLPPLKKIWVEDTIALVSANSVLSALDNTFFQVPEIDPNSFGSAFALLVGSLGLIERRARRVRSLLTGA